MAELKSQFSAPIVFFDSGVGGLTVLHEALRYLPGESFVYYADRDNMPYGDKSSSEIDDLVKEAAAFLDILEPKALVLACNTATSVVVKELRRIYTYPIIGMEPAIKPAAELASEKKILVTATRRTLSEAKLERLIAGLNAEDRVEKMPLPGLVELSEQYEFQTKHVSGYLEKEFEHINWDEYASVVLGCTHFIYFRKELRNFLPEHIQIIDGNLGTVKRLKSLIPENNDQLNNSIEYYTSKRKENPEVYSKYLRYLDTQYQ